MNKNNNIFNNFNGSIKTLYYNGIENELASIDKRLVDKTYIIVKKIAEISECLDSDKYSDIEDMLLNNQIECAECFFEAGFRKAMNLMLDTLAGGVTPQ